MTTIKGECDNVKPTPVEVLNIGRSLSDKEYDAFILWAEDMGKEGKDFRDIIINYEPAENCLSFIKESIQPYMQ